MKRREVLSLLPVVSMAAASRVDAALGKNVDQGLVLEAPEDVFVVKLPKLQGKVRKGEIVANLTSPKVNWLQNQLEASKEELDIQDRFFTENTGNNRRAEIEKVLDEQVRIAEEALGIAREFYKKLVSAPPASAPVGMEQLRQEKQSIEPEAKLLNAQRDQLSSKARFEDLQEHLAINRRRLNTNYELLKESRKRLDIVAPTDGWFVSSIAEGGFVLAGDPVGIIHLGVTTAQKQRLTCAAPDDVTVESLRTTNGEVLSDGEPVASLKSNRIERYKARLQAVKNDLAVQQRFFTRGRKEKWETRLRDAVESGERRVKNATLIEAHCKNSLLTGGTVRGLRSCNL